MRGRPHHHGPSGCVSALVCPSLAQPAHAVAFSDRLLTPGRTESVRLELYFTPRQNVSFLCVGAARVSLGGVIHRGANAAPATGDPVSFSARPSHPLAAEVHEEDPMEEFEHNLMAMMNGFGAPVELDASKLGPEQQRVAGLLQNVFEERAKVEEMAVIFFARSPLSTAPACARAKFAG